ncbi:zinc finger protein Gfi-1b-like [Ctenocephalides felis]|uniref:zinc finger protein Gfi-1b-like n=1 Tax=Ctenocephalides felis TaxID=7515 RepID=UPI000E6E4699|nr:zinc finger protein Gfi-1b-like [Ctenocephalides felis]XP_026476081.1 zinc finger protein Gfi-1b-like [Ctenocephalides felis]
MVIYEKQVFACDLCCEGFLHATSLEKHKELHSKNDAYACKVCNCFFLNQETLLVHKNTHHKNIMTQDILSEISDDVKPLLNVIKEEKHDNSVDSFSPENGKRIRGRPKQSQGQKVGHQCTICMEFFDKKLQLKRHTMSAHRDKLVTVE